MSLAHQFPPHQCELHLTHNEHRNNYQTLEQFAADRELDLDDWVSVEQRDKAMAAQDVWELHWYPDTPVGFYRLFAYDLDVLLAAARDVI